MKPIKINYTKKLKILQTEKLSFKLTLIKLKNTQSKNYKCYNPNLSKRKPIKLFNKNYYIKKQ